MTSIFISYSSKDVEIAKIIQKCLEDEGFQVWRDERSIETDWSAEISNELTKCDIKSPGRNSFLSNQADTSWSRSHRCIFVAKGS